MKYGLIGETLVHSYSKIIHESIEDITYDLVSLKKDEVDSFMKDKNFNAINVTIPYKETVIPYLNEMDDVSREIGSVNCIKNNNGYLKGYNTDTFGFIEMLKFHEIDCFNKTVMVLGSGGTYKTAIYSLKKLGAKKIYSVSRNKKDGFLTYDECKELKDVEVIVNTTPIGMYPHIDDEMLISLDDYPILESVVDVIYNPFRTKLLIMAKEKGLKICSGLYMLVAQAVKALEIFLDKTYEKEIYEREYYNILFKTSNLVFIGMPACGKSSCSLKLSLVMNKKRYDVDQDIEESLHMSVNDIFKNYGEEFFRKMESKRIFELSNEKGIIISTGGGALMNRENARNLVRNGYLIFLNRPVDDIKSNPKTRLTRPLLTDSKKVDELYKVRYPIYHLYKDYEFINGGSKNDTLRKVMDHLKVKDETINN